MVEQHIIQNCAVSSLYSMLSTKLHEAENPELERLIQKFLNLFTEGVGVYTGFEFDIEFDLSMMQFLHDLECRKCLRLLPSW